MSERRYARPFPTRAAADPVVERFLAGDPAALRELYDRHAAVVHGFALRCLREHHDVEDVTQQVFVRAWRGRATFDPRRGPVGGWLMGIARHQIADRLTARTRDTEVTARNARAAGTGGTEQVPDHVVESMVVADELNRLPPQQRTVLRLAFFDDLTHHISAEKRDGNPGHSRISLLRGTVL